MLGQPEIYDSYHQKISIRNWKRNGLILIEGETYKGIYYHVMSINNCELCNVEFNNEVHNEKRCMDHDHATGYFRQVLCMKCNTGFDRQTPKMFRIQKNKTGHMWIMPIIIKKKSKISVSFRYKRTGFKRKESQSLTTLICLSFINLIKKPI
tara:strand:- start:2 stop:457 length:456 start_codon:yes stop_codon:yes gene_type:complete